MKAGEQHLNGDSCLNYCQGQNRSLPLNSFSQVFIGKRLYKVSLTSSRTSVYNAIKTNKKISLLGQIWTERESKMFQI